MWNAFKYVELLTNLLYILLRPFFSEEFLSTWKPIHLCHWFRSNSKPIPRYFIGGGGDPPSVTTNAATNVHKLVATGNGNITSDGGASITARGFTFSSTDSTPTIGEGGVTNIVEGGTATGTYSDSLTPLEANTLYYYQAYATNSKGTTYGGVQSFTTDALVSTVLNTPADTATGQSTTPTLEFTGTDSEGLDVEYQVQVDTVNTFDSQAGSGAWSEQGTATTITGSGLNSTSIAALSSTRIVVADVSADTLQTYDWGGSSWSTVGNALTLTSAGEHRICALSSSRIAYINSSDDNLETYDFDGTDWSQTGNSLSVAVGNCDLATLSSTRVCLIDGTGDSMETYDFDGTDWSQTGNTLTITGQNRGAICGMTSSRIAYVDTDGEQLRAYDFDGTDWSQTGNSFTISNIVGTKPAIGTLTSSSVAFVDEDDAYIRTYSFDGTNWSEINTAFSLGTITYPELDAMSSSAIAYYDFTNDELRYYQLGGPLIDADSEVPDAGFANTVTPADTHPFNSGEKADYDVQAGDTLDASTTYYWRVRGKDPTQSDTYGAWATTRSFTTSAGSATNVVQNIIANA
jgi:hypothetical protein